MYVGNDGVNNQAHTVLYKGRYSGNSQVSDRYNFATTINRADEMARLPMYVLYVHTCHM